MAGIKRITREEISTIRDDEDPWKIVINPRRPRKRQRLADGEASPTYVYEQNLEEFDRRLNFRYSVTLYGQLVDWKKKGKGADKFKTYDKIEYSGLVIRIGDIVYVNFGDPEALSQRQNSVENAAIKRDLDDDSDRESPSRNSVDAPHPDGEEDMQEPIPDWVAKVLECRAFDEEHVFLRVLWLYRPEDLPGGRQPWHGWNEVFPSNNMQIIDAMTVTNMAKGLVKWDEKSNQNIEDDVLIWRQPCKVEVKSNHVVTNVLGKLPTYCICREPAHPDRHLIRCPACENWMHDTCIELAAAREASTKALKESERPPEKDEVTTSGVVETVSEENEDDTKPIQSTHFNPITGAVKLITNQLKRAASPLKNNSTSRMVSGATTAIGDLGRTIVETVAPTTLTKTYSARIVGLDADDTGVPKRIEIRSHAAGHEDTGGSVTVEKIRCLFCQNEIE